MEFLAPFHRLTKRERGVAARILIQYFRFRERMPDPDPEVIRDLLWSKKSKADMMASLKITPAHFQMVMQKLRKAGFLIKDDAIEPKYIPCVTNEPRFMLQIVFDYSSPAHPIHNEESGQ